MKTKLILLLIIAALFAMGVLLWKVRPVSLPKNSVAQSDLTALTTQIEVFRQEQGRYPSTEEGLDILVHAPRDPKTLPNWSQRMLSVWLDPWHHPYQYKCPGRHNPNGFDLYSLGADGTESSDDIYSTPWSAEDRQRLSRRLLRGQSEGPDVISPTPENSAHPN